MNNLGGLTLHTCRDESLLLVGGSLLGSRKISENVRNTANYLAPGVHIHAFDSIITADQAHSQQEN